MTTAFSTRGQARRTEILEIARATLIDEGLDRFVLRNVAARAKMTLGNLQYYFATRDALLEAVFRAEFERDLDIVRTTIEGCADPDCAMGEIADQLVGHWCDGGSGVFNVLNMLANHQERFRELNREIYETFYAELAKLIEVAEPGIGAAEAQARSRLIAAVLDGVAVQNHAGVGQNPADCDALLERAGALVLRIATGTA